jgi:hypothetical protein
VALSQSSPAGIGLFTALYRLESAEQLEPGEIAWFHEQEAWFNQNLATPTQLSRSKRPGAHKAALLWFKDTATEHVRRMHALTALLRQRDVPVEILVSDTPGYVVYEDPHQVAAEPFVL